MKEKLVLHHITGDAELALQKIESLFYHIRDIHEFPHLSRWKNLRTTFKVREWTFGPGGPLMSQIPKWDQSAKVLILFVPNPREILHSLWTGFQLAHMTMHREVMSWNLGLSQVKGTASATPFIKLPPFKIVNQDQGRTKNWRRLSGESEERT